jgi:Transglutaminase-like superfamily
METMRNRLLFISLLIFNSFLSSGQPKQGVDYLAILRRAQKYDLTDTKQIPHFTYQSSNDSVLVALRKNFNLDSIAGFGNTTSRLLNLLHWVHNTVGHDGQNASGLKNINANSIIEAARKKNIGVSCGELATALNDCYLAMGFHSRKVYCFPKDSLKTDLDSHVINVVYLSSKNKWIWLDPTNDAYVMDEKGELLSIDEVRERLILNKPLIVNPDANWNHRTSMTKEYYLDNYMAKNLYRVYCPLNSEYDYQTYGRNKTVTFINLLPFDNQNKMPLKAAENYKVELKTTFINYNIYNPTLFWQAPKDE